MFMLSAPTLCLNTNMSCNWSYSARRINQNECLRSIGYRLVAPPALCASNRRSIQPPSTVAFTVGGRLSSDGGFARALSGLEIATLVDCPRAVRAASLEFTEKMLGSETIVS